MVAIKKIIISVLSICVFAIVGYFLLELFIPGTEQTNQNNQLASQEQMKIDVDLVAIGDSLTEGVGDSTHRGGYVPMVADLLKENTHVKSVETANYGHAGDTSKQLLTLLKENEDAQTDLKEATIITITIGGNDIVKNFGKVGLNGSVEDFEPTIQAYEKNLNQIFELLNQYNDQATMYIYGLYNPYHYYFSEFQELQAVFDLWNQRTLQFAEDRPNVRFVEIDSRFNPSEAPQEIESPEESADSLDEIQDKNHPYLYKEDLFHPNDSGYQIMAQALRDAINKDLENTKASLSMNK
ncbi:SGNH/GDSL hydrolase family protein [Marinilactibacillus kalidii]|uniref:SGNH/GDSL hydrolase family protein n=1 Tax=Marinilactibacillus kalidii TaxID=2820274 RepID=UPI001ABDF0DB|nr:SGNH/GDSL hydrolase family protein [Marinilactibacillus kalidii]